MINHPNRSKLKEITLHGDWLVNGCIDNLDRQRCMTVYVAPDGKLYGEGQYGGCDRDNPLTIDSEGNIAWSGSVEFCPDAGELNKLLVTP